VEARRKLGGSWAEVLYTACLPPQEAELIDVLALARWFQVGAVVGTQLSLWNSRVRTCVLEESL
jgi:hypothetical protein